MDYKQEIKDYALSLGVFKCGIASMDRYAEATKGQHPQELLPGCRSAIVVATRLLDGAVSANFRKFEDGMDDVHGIYGTFGYTMGPTFHMSGVLYAVAQKIERETGKTAMPMYCGGPLVNGAALSMRHSAVAAGLGEFGWNSIVLTPEYGPRNRFGVVLTTLELEPDPMYHGPKLCDPSKCNICYTHCPTGAIEKWEPGAGRVCHSGDVTSVYCHLNWNKCKIACHMLTKKVGGKEDYIFTEDPTTKDIDVAMNAKPFETTGVQINPTWKCGHCMSYCPAGNWKEHFDDKGLTNGGTVWR